jgi:carbamate kinase
VAEGVILVALGGNALLKAHEVGSAAEQLGTVARTSRVLGAMVEGGRTLVLTHGNGPQVGSLLIQNEDARRDVPAMPLDVLGAESQGQIGYMLQQGLSNELGRRGIRREVITLLTQTVVDPDDPAFGDPTKPVGPYYTAAEADELARDKDWVMREEPDGWRRVVASPDPIEIVEAPTIARLVAECCVVIAVGGGGVPVARTPAGLVGLEAVVDKDLASERLATAIGAKRLLMLTTVHHVVRDFGEPSAEPIESMTVAQARALAAAGQFGRGSMGPKVEAACRFVEAGGECAGIAHLDEAAEAMEGSAGTRIVGTGTCS